MLAILGSNTETIEKIFTDNKDKYQCFIANDNSNGQLVVSGKMENIDKAGLKEKSYQQCEIALSMPTVNKKSRHK